MSEPLFYLYVIDKPALVLPVKTVINVISGDANCKTSNSKSPASTGSAKPVTVPVNVSPIVIRPVTAGVKVTVAVVGKNGVDPRIAPVAL